ncbi:hypothetical protein QAD02_013844 [Eretmocerus hayati]|uniref:Uncharacterized protein n=1 Tax=Eretmocerus hayati TaxID=131215 RepID=A0ACC2P6G2_9HYME|nr:hypothetical protein QAD02_013844 [Eretmocerus hayati]
MLRGGNSWIIANDAEIKDNSSFSSEGNPYVIILRKIEAIEHVPNPRTVEYLEPMQSHQHHENDIGLDSNRSVLEARESSENGGIEKEFINIVSESNTSHVRSTRKRSLMKFLENTVQCHIKSALQILSQISKTESRSCHHQLGIPKTMNSDMSINNPKKLDLRKHNFTEKLRGL